MFKLQLLALIATAKPMSMNITIKKANVFNKWLVDKINNFAVQLNTQIEH